MTDISGLRLEVLPNEGLPSRGPGRAPDGNFVLTEMEVLAAPKADPKQVKPVKLQTPLADFSQKGYSVAAAIDGGGSSSFGIMTATSVHGCFPRILF